MRLYQSIYETALRNKVPATVIEDMIRIYSYDVDFQRKVQPGNSFDVFYRRRRRRRRPSPKRPRCCSPRSPSAARPRNTIASRPPTTAVVDYYDETGKSAKKFLVRKPVNNAIMRSGFGGRRHPILGYVKMHTGVDWATPYGTPIFASGNGVVEKVGREGGYGKYVRLKHNNGYETAYGHMSAFAKGMEPGKRVRQGQVIGFVGSTGHVDRRPRPLRNPGQRPLRRSDAHQAAARPLARRAAAGELREGTRSSRRHDEQRGGTARISDATGTAGVRQISNR